MIKDTVQNYVDLVTNQTTEVKKGILSLKGQINRVGEFLDKSQSKVESISAKLNSIQSSQNQFDEHLRQISQKMEIYKALVTKIN